MGYPVHIVYSHHQSSHPISSNLHLRASISFSQLFILLILSDFRLISSISIKMYTPSVLVAAILLLSSTITASPVPQSNNERRTDSYSVLSLTDKLILAPTAADRLALLTEDSDFIYDFAHPPAGASTTGFGGHTVKADRKTFPALIGNGGSVTVGFLGACGFNTPHVHPRAAELNLVVEGRLISSVTAENGARHMNHTMEKFQMTVFPAGALHTEYNPDCANATFVASFPSEDPGVLQAAQAFFGLEKNIIEAAVGGSVSVAGQELEKFRNLIPANVALGVDACLSKCGLKKY